MRKLSPLGKDKRGFSTVMAIISSVIGMVFLIIFGFVFVTQMVDTNLLTAGSDEETATNNLRGNFTAGVEEVSSQLPTVFSIGVFVLVITVLLIAYVIARRNGVIGSSGSLG
jgi:phosphotransferase system  glucose/maltose/N-acetylglucosamine-specific IIC component